MPRYHVNPETQRPNICRAKSEATCKFAQDGKAPEHYDNPEEAKAAVEQANSRSYETFTAHSKRPEPPVLVLDTLEALPKFRNEEERLSYHTKDSCFSCPECGTPFTNKQANRLLCNDYVACPKCCKLDEEEQEKVSYKDRHEDGVYRIVDADLEPRSAFADVLVNTERAKDRRWIHATERGEKWYQELLEAQEAGEEGTAVVHAGAPEAAVDRMLTDYNRNWEYGRAERGETDLYFFELELSPAVKVDEELGEDANDIDEVEDNTATVYKNRWEAPGTLSVAARPQDWRVVGLKKVKAKDLWDYRTLYNIPESR